MRNFFLLLSAIVMLLSYSSCKKDNQIEEGIRKEVKVTASFKSLTSTSSVTTRAVDNAWESGDAIGIFMKTAGSDLLQPALAENAKYVTTDLSTFTPATEGDKIYYPFDKSEVDFISYYPYTAALGGLNYEIDVADQTNLAAIDLLYSNNVKAVNSTKENINLSFEHQLTKVVLKIATNHTEKELTDLSAKITTVNTKASFSLVDGSMSIVSEPEDVSFKVDSTGTVAEAIVLPTDILTDKKIVITIDGTNYSYLLSNSTTIKSFDKSKKCEYTVTIEPTHGPLINNVTAEITDWTTVSDDITVVEDSSATNPDGDSGEGGTPPEDETPTEGNGTKESPYSIAQVKEMTEGTGIWVKGYIVGGYKSEFTAFSRTNTSLSEKHLALADLPEESSGNMTFPVDLLEGGVANIMDKLNLKKNFQNLEKSVLLRGDIGRCGIMEPLGLINIKKAFLENVEITNN